MIVWDLAHSLETQEQSVSIGSRAKRDQERFGKPENSLFLKEILDKIQIGCLINIFFQREQHLAT